MIIITGTGRAFSAGADIAAFQEHMRAGPEAAVMHFMRPGHRMTRRVDSFPKPIIAAVNGIAFGGGCELIESTDIALAAETSTFSKAEINIGIIPTFGGTQRLPRNIGRKAAIELNLSGRTFPSKEAANLGLVNRVVADADLMREALRLANGLASQPPLTLRAALAAIHRGMDASIDDGLAIEESAFARMCRLPMLRRVWPHSSRSVLPLFSADSPFRKLRGQSRIGERIGFDESGASKSGSS